MLKTTFLRALSCVICCYHAQKQEEYSASYSSVVSEVKVTKAKKPETWVHEHGGGTTFSQCLGELCWKHTKKGGEKTPTSYTYG